MTGKARHGDEAFCTHHHVVVMDERMRRQIESFARAEVQNEHSASWLLAFGTKYLASAADQLLTYRRLKHPKVDNVVDWAIGAAGCAVAAAVVVGGEPLEATMSVVETRAASEELRGDVMSFFVAAFDLFGYTGQLAADGDRDGDVVTEAIRTAAVIVAGCEMFARDEG